MHTKPAAECRTYQAIIAFVVSVKSISQASGAPAGACGLSQSGSPPHS